MSPAERIQQLLLHKPGLKAQQIAEELGIERSQVVTILHHLPGGDVVQDNAYRWWPKARRSQRPATVTQPPRTFLASVCRYFLDCLSHESGSGISLPIDGSDYIPLSELPFAGGAEGLSDSGRGIRKMVQRVSRERGQLALYIGYAIRLRSIVSRSEEQRRIEPVLLYPVEELPDEFHEPLRPSSSVPLFNLEVLKSLPSVDSGNVIDEAIHLSEELGLTDPDEDLPQWDEIILRLQKARPDWGWQENLNPYELPVDPPLSALNSPGIYNRAILFAGTRSPFTYGLEVELRKLMLVSDEAVRDTALGPLLRGEVINTSPPEDRPILSVLPLNNEQRQAVVQGLGAPLTVVTGPPGTGKSQVVTSLLANVAWHGGNALFSSKNNHAVDVVESRTNDLGPYPLLLRLGKEEHHARIAQHLSAALAESSSNEVSARYNLLIGVHEQSLERFAEIQDEISSVIALRNHVDELERAAEPARAVLSRQHGGDHFARLRAADLDTIRGRLRAFSEALAAVDTAGQTSMVRLLRDSVRGRRLQRIEELAAEMRSDAALIGITPPLAAAGELGIDDWKEFHGAMARRIDLVIRIRDYWSALDRLRAAPAIEQLAQQLTRVAGESSQSSLELWQTWLRLQPSRWTSEQRRLLSEYVSLLQMVAGGDRHDEGAGRKVFRRYYSVFPQVSKILPCWAVTSLSARGRLPFEPAIFDLVVIDEASQCDIASALPLLFRARRAMIIGDPLQLKHVSTIAPQQDRLMLAAHGLAEGAASWAYSINSLFDLARSFCRAEDIVNLRDHHRSHRDIISFSNRHFYRGGLRIATDHQNLNRPASQGPAVRWVDVRGKVARPAAGGALNTIEADVVITELKKLVVEDGYNGAIGVVTPFRAQANRIRALVHQEPELSGKLASLQFVVDTVHGFQGDERDVIFFSPVVSAGVPESTVRFLKSHANLFNVAVTRARSELVVVGDRKAAIDSGISYLASFAEYSRFLGSTETRAPNMAEAGPEYPLVSHPELVSDWERIFYRALYAAGVRPVPQYEEAPYTLDFALFDGDRKLDIEVDGENYHRNWDGELCRRDQIRSRRLADLGWDIMRFWVYEIRDDLEGSVKRVKAWLTAPDSTPRET